MALPLNNFRTVTAVLTQIESTLYTTPANLTTIVLGAQCANVTTSSATVTFVYSKNGVDTELLKDFVVPPNDAVNIVSGKLVLETGSVVKALTGTDQSCKVTLSILETSNE